MIDFQNARFLKLRAVDSKTLSGLIGPILVKGEYIVRTFLSIRDSVVFTNKRIIAVNVQGVTGKKKEFSTLPYSKIQAFSMETAGVLDIDSELQLWYSSLGMVSFAFSSGADAEEICRIIGESVL